MVRFDVVVIGAGLGGLTTAAILARAGRKVLVVERSNSVGGAASSYKVGDLFVEGSLHETSDPRDPRDPKHEALSRAGVLDAVTWSSCGTLYEVRGGPIETPLSLPDNFDGAREVLIHRFPDARDGIDLILREMEKIASTKNGLLSGHDSVAETDRSLSLQQKFDRVLGDNEAVKCALAANLAYYHDDPASLWWTFFAMAQGSYFLNGASFIKGGSQRLSSALARVVKSAGGDVLIRRHVSAVTPQADGVGTVTHSAKGGGDAQTVKAVRIVSNVAPDMTAALLPDMSAAVLRRHYAGRKHSISLFALTLGLSKPPRELGISSYSTQLLPPWLKRLSDYGQGTSLLAEEPADRMPPLAIVDYAAIDSGVPAPPYALSIVGPDQLSNWSTADADTYRAKRARWQEAIVTYLDGYYPGLKVAVTSASFNTALSVRQYLGTPDGAVYGFAPLPPASSHGTSTRSPSTPIEGLYLSSAYAGFGGYSGVIQAAATCADVIIREG